MKEENVISGHTASVTCLSVLGSRLVTGSSDKTLRLWNINTNNIINIYTGHTKRVGSYF